MLAANNVAIPGEISVDLTEQFKRLHGFELFSRIFNCRVLVVGSGGIGCELLKTLVLTGFRLITVVDLDTIELSNLNRQFLFRQHHIGRGKALVAKEAIEQICPAATISAHHGSIKDRSKFPLSWWRQFDLVMSALDNADARRYVNNVCQTLGKTVVESGTAGYLGQSTVVLPRRTECFDCRPKQAAKTYPVCTIRTTPSALIHCVVWAKDLLFASLFGQAREELDMPATNEHASEAVIANLNDESRGFKRLRALARDNNFPKQLFMEVFGKDIGALLDMSELWTERRAPVPMTEQDLSSASHSQSRDQQSVWPISEWIDLFCNSARRMAVRAFPPSSSSETEFFEQFFDKDDDDALDFVASAANIRAHIFGIAMNSRFELKAMAGNIIPAIATTNAMAAGLMVIQATNVLSGKPCSTTYITHGRNSSDIFINEELAEPSPACSTCNVHRVLLKTNTASLTLAQIVGELKDELVLQYESHSRKHLADFDDMTVLEGSRILYDIDMPSSILLNTLKDLGISDSQFIRVEIASPASFSIAIIDDASMAGGYLVEKIDFLPTRLEVAHLKYLEESKAAMLGEKRARGEDDSDSDVLIEGGGEDELESIESIGFTEARLDAKHTKGSID